MNIMSCHVFSKHSISKAILTCRSALVSYYIFKVFFVVETEVGGVDNIPTRVKDQINAADLHQ